MMLNGKKALVTGASRGIGKAIADLFVANGAEVWGLDLREPADLDERVAAAGGRLHWAVADLGRLSEIDGAVKGALEQAGGFDVLVNNAGITRDGLSFRMSLDDWQKVIDVNLSAAFFVARTVAWDMIQKRRGGSIVNMASVVGIHGNGGQANYAASKAGLVAVTKSLAQEVAARGIRVNAIAPGFIDSDMTAVLPQDVKDKMLGAIPFRRFGQPADVANAALFLASDLSSYITGQALPVDGGMFM
ncbi:MAG: 3-oxoacyl-[acyl-carrier-protein] reductase [Treponema sp.]|nr:3-oxoacyl-[acyl-carrier-protein] reductase [Treponema sp.]